MQPDARMDAGQLDELVLAERIRLVARRSFVASLSTPVAATLLLYICHLPGRIAHGAGWHTPPGGTPYDQRPRSLCLTQHAHSLLPVLAPKQRESSPRLAGPRPRPRPGTAAV